MILSCKFAVTNSTFNTFGITCNLSKIKCTTPNMNVLCRRALRCYRIPCAVLPMNTLCHSAALLLKCLLLVYIWPEKGVDVYFATFGDIYHTLNPPLAVTIYSVWSRKEAPLTWVTFFDLNAHFMTSLKSSTLLCVTASGSASMTPHIQ